ncbi:MULTISPECIES: TA system toxin CbtA family protein [Xenorhabdus]|uniref:TA system toxin CbtA family protein n=1 Tax=Xenorhabdus TaxID=626 RepID=UPI00064B4F99|nr:MULTISPECIES: TA system toxin CbtA family protein [Xenorhabdus]KLU15814.1 toxin-antitoxin protein [Xenorhabdus griffiniae]KOP34718.1 toxin-antitoxin protein [Xenorhabdus sp. GDc328]WFQ79593.1 TA system toxin CbtA family protein [Xenorhabdus sp. SF857]
MAPLRLTVWQVIAGTLLKRHFGLNLEDTVLYEADTVAELMAHGVQPFEAINALVDKYDLTRLDAQDMQGSTPYLGIHDELRVLFDCGITETMLSQANGSPSE